MRKKIVLSDRLEAVIALVPAGRRVCDVGCDHGFVPIALVQRGISPGALAMDAREGPLRQAGEHIAACGLDAYIETRLSDGLCAYRTGEADSLICAGMGGRLMMRILEEDAAKTASFQELILQPQSEIQQFRSFLRRRNYLSVEENIIEEDGKFYPMMKVIRNETITRQESLGAGWWQRMEDRYGSLLLQRKHPVLYRYLERERCICETVLEQLRTQDMTGDRRRERYGEVEEQLRDCLRVMETLR